MLKQQNKNKETFLTIPTNLNIKVLNNNNKIFLILYKKNFFCILQLKNKFYLDLSTNIFSYKNLFKNRLYDQFKNNIYKLNLFLKYYYILKQYKIVFKGKSYKIRKTSNKQICINLDFHKAHRSFFLYKNILIKKLRKQKLLFLSSDYFFLSKIIGDIIKIRSLNSYTKRGLRLKSQFFFKRSSKKSLKKQ